MGSLQPTEQLAGENPFKEPQSKVFVVGWEAQSEGMEEQLSNPGVPGGAGHEEAGRACLAVVSGREGF